MSEPQQDKQAVKQTRDILNARLGEMITGLLGDDSLEKKYAAGPVADAAGASAEKVGIVSADTKTALLIAQAAERTLRAAEKVTFFHIHRDQIVEDVKQEVKDKQAEHAETFRARSEEHQKIKNPPNFFQRVFGLHAAPVQIPKEERFAFENGQRQIANEAYARRETALGYVSPKADTFKYVGAEGDAPALKSAQATMLAAQMYLNNEIESRLYKSDFPLDYGVSEVGESYTQGLKQKAAADFKIAAALLDKEGHGPAAVKLNAVANSIAVTAPDAPGPDVLVKKLYKQEEANVDFSNQQMSMWTMATFGHRAGFEKENCDRLMKLINPQSGGLDAAPAPTIKAGNTPAFNASKPA